MESLTSNSSKLLQLFALLPRRPREFYNRVAAILDSGVEVYRHGPPQYETLSWDVLMRQLTRFLPADVEAVLREDELNSVEEEVSCRIRALPPDTPFPLYHNGDFSLARLCYLLVRVMRPASVVETGVCYGVTSAFLLQALRANGTGCLHSIDLPPLGRAGDEFVGRLVPEHLTNDWRLHRGRSVDLLPELERELRPIDFFLHDSLHTYRNMHREFEIITPFLSPQAVLVADDVEGNSAFMDWVSQTRPSYSAVLEEHSKQSLLGVAVLAARRGSVISPEPEADSHPASSK
jgi:predicted O-methyltransferase YrrM